ncbi:CynX/NimT family MFS transporter [Nocardia sp. KC 131]|uniref:MFS transporter n=1 Tax=Nocardia arseniciresistens TaxID=3392119 RepID=UPI00398EE2D8
MTSTRGAVPSHLPTGSGAVVWAPLAVAMAAAGFSLRPPITGVGAALGFIPETTGLNQAVLGWVVSVPLWCYAVGGVLAPWLSTRWGPIRTVAVALAIMTVGQIVRVAGGAGLLLAGTMVTASATAVVAPLLPAIAGSSGARMTRLTAIYAPAIGIGSAAGAFVTAPVSAATSWRWGLGLWAPLCAVALVLWLGAQRRPAYTAVLRPAAAQSVSVRWGLALRRRLSWSMAFLFGAWAVTAFGIMSWLPSIYRDAGIDGAQAGFLLGLAAVAGIPVAVVLPGWLRRSCRGRWRDAPIVVGTAIPSAGLLGLWRIPTTAPWLWAVAIGAGLGALSLTLTLIPLSAPEPQWATTISAVTHGLGYALAGGGVAALSALHVHTGGWGPIVWLLLVMCVVQAVAGMTALRSGITPHAGATRGGTDVQTPVGGKHPDHRSPPPDFDPHKNGQEGPALDTPICQVANE